MDKTAVFYGSNGGVTEDIAKQIASGIGANAEVFDVANTNASRVEEFSNVVLGSSTWGIGDLQDDWEDFLPQLAQADLSNKKVALFGVGDCMSYPDSFVDAIGTIYEKIKDKGCTIIGEVDASGYDFSDSTAVFNGKFVGLPIDEDNESDRTEERISNWLGAIIPLFN